MRTFLVKDKKPICCWGSLPDGVLYKGDVPNGYNLGVSPTPGYIIIDIDNHDGGKNGFDIIPGKIMQELLTTLNYRTKHDGMHCWFKYTGTKKLANKTCGKGIDLRNEKGYVVWWPKEELWDSMRKIKESSPVMNEWLEELFCYKIK